jgi:hypothetical protein
MFWYKKTPPATYLDKQIDTAYSQGAREERRQIVALLDKLIEDDSQNSEWYCALMQARTEILARGLN